MLEKCFYTELPGESLVCELSIAHLSINVRAAESNGLFILSEWG